MKKVISACTNIIDTSIAIKNLVISILIMVLGEYWFVFVAYMIFNIWDWVTGSLKAIRLKEVSSYIGIKGLIKKLGCWVVVGIAFGFSSIFVMLGEKISGVNFSIMYLIGWFTLASLIISEIVSILENLVELNIEVPDILIKSLKVTKKVMDSTSEKALGFDDETLKIKKNNN